MTIRSAVKESLSVPLLFSRSLVTVLGDRQLRKFCFLPYCAGGLVFVGLFFLAWHYRGALPDLLIPSTSSFWHGCATALGFLLNLLLAALTASLSALIVGSFMLEALVLEALKRHGVVPELGTGIFMPLIKSSITEVVCIAFALGLWLLGVILSFIPLIAWIPPLIACLLVGYAVLGVPFSLLNLPTRLRLTIFRDKLLPTAVLGGLTSLLGAIPILGIIVAPAILYSAAVLSAQWLRADSAETTLHAVTQQLKATKTVLTKR